MSGIVADPIQVLSSLPIRVRIATYCVLARRPFVKFQVDDMEWLSDDDLKVACVCRSRGGSKTMDLVDWLILHVLITRQTWLWLACKSGQLRQAKVYFRRNPFVQSERAFNGSTTQFTLLNGCIITVGIMSSSNLGLRVDGILYDEFEDMENKQEEEVFPEMTGMMTASPIHRQIYAGTLKEGALLNEFVERYPAHIRPWTTIPWLVASGLIQAEIDAGITPPWQIDMYYGCIPTLPGGRVFPRVVTTDLNHMGDDANAFGIDWGGTDHIVGILETDLNWIVLFEREINFDADPTSVDFLRGQSVESEDGFYNVTKAQLLRQRIPCTQRRVDRDWINARIAMGRAKPILIDANRTPNTYKDVKSLGYDPNPVEGGRYLKDKDHPCHWADAFLHAMGARKQRYVTTQGTENARNREILRQDAERDRSRMRIR